MGTFASKEWVKSLLSKMNIGKYSTDEVRIGTWIDGKPLYRKVVSYGLNGLSANANIYVPINASVDTFVNICAFVARTDGNNNILPYAHRTSMGNQTQMIVIDNKDTGHPNTIQVLQGANALTTANKIYATVEYTKTTD